MSTLTLPRLPGRLPQWPVSAAFVALFNGMTWRGLRELDWASLEGKRFCVEVSDLGVRSHFSVHRRGLKPQFGDHADVTFAASARDFLHLALRLEDPDTLFFNRRLRIEGNTDLGLTVKNMLDAVELDQVLADLPVPVALLLRSLRTRLAGSAAVLA
ncbi:MAG: ubiquinone anaerobic biosynthesis accessory factor UbiT [Pseudomonadota bacterium]